MTTTEQKTNEFQVDEKWERLARIRQNDPAAFAEISIGEQTMTNVYQQKKEKAEHEKKGATK